MNLEKLHHLYVFSVTSTRKLALIYSTVAFLDQKLETNLLFNMNG